MIKEIDLRDFDTSSESFSPNETKTSKKISKKTIGNYNISIKNIDFFSGNPSDIIVESAPKTPNDYVTRSLDYLNNISTTFGFDESNEQQPEFDAILMYRKHLVMLLLYILIKIIKVYQYFRQVLQ